LRDLKNNSGHSAHFLEFQKLKRGIFKAAKSKLGILCISGDGQSLEKYMEKSRLDPKMEIVRCSTFSLIIQPTMHLVNMGYYFS